MKTISYANIIVEGFTFKRILSIYITPILCSSLAVLLSPPNLYPFIPLFSKACIIVAYLQMQSTIYLLILLCLVKKLL